MLDDTVSTDRRDVISMIACAEDYGHLNQVTAHWFSCLLGGVLTDEEIVAYALEVASKPEYGLEDYTAICRRLRWFREHMLIKAPEL